MQNRERLMKIDDLVEFIEENNKELNFFNIYADHAKTKPYALIIEPSTIGVTVIYAEDSMARAYRRRLQCVAIVKKIHTQTIAQFREELGMLVVSLDAEGDMENARLIKRWHELHPETFEEYPTESEYEIAKDDTARKLIRLAKDSAAKKNRKHSYDKESTTQLYTEEEEKTILKITLEARKRELKNATPMFQRELDILTPIKGVGPMSTIYIAALAHPNNFSTLSKYKKYCGYMKDVKASGKYNHYVHSIFGQLAVSVKKKMNSAELREIYVNRKAELLTRTCDECRSAICSMSKRDKHKGGAICPNYAEKKALNYLATHILKLTYYALRDIPKTAPEGWSK